MATKNARRTRRKSRVPRKLNFQNIQPPSREVILKYVDTGNIPGALGFGFDTWNLNSVFDVYAGLGGHQPYLADQMALFYSKYVVHKVDVKVMIASSSTTSWIGMRPDDEVTVIPTSVSKEQELQDVVIKTTSTDNPVMLQKSYDINKIFGITKTKLMAENTYAAATTSDPGTLAQLYLFQESVTGGANTIYYNIEFDFHVKYYSRIELAQS